MVVLFQLRLVQGDVYPAYSTHRADPMGTQALYEALRQQPGLHVERNEHAIEKFRWLPDTTVILAGAYDTPDPESIIEAVEAFVLMGGRLVIAFQPSGAICWNGSCTGDTCPADRSDHDESGEGEEEGGADEDDEDERLTEPMVKTAERWGYEHESEETKDGEAHSRQRLTARRAKSDESLPLLLPWRSPDYFSKLADHWEILYERGAGALVIEREWGSGSLVLCSDSYCFSNEAMQRDREPAFLAWLVGSNHRVIFDEAHHGIVRREGNMNLIRKYRLHYVLLALIPLVALFVWQSMSTLVPRRDEAAGYDHEIALEGHGAASALTQLLGRSVPRNALLRACVEAWRHDAPLAAEPKEIETILARQRTTKDPVTSGYRAICQVVNRKTGDRP